eukprot:COSAG01_NODE_32612_length_578_cov_1.144050_1_plen_72_part_10
MHIILRLLYASLFTHILLCVDCRISCWHGRYVYYRRKDTRSIMPSFEWAKEKKAKHCPPTCIDCANRELRKR